MRKNRIRSISIAALLTVTSVTVLAPAAQAYQPDAVADPGCNPIEWADGCKAQQTYRAVLAAINTAIASPKNEALREGTVKQLFFEVYGGGLVDWDGYKPVNKTARIRRTSIRPPTSGKRTRPMRNLHATATSF